MERKIYLDHAATTPLDREVFEKMTPFYTDVFGNADSLHSFGRGAQNAVDEARDKVAFLIGAKPSEVYFTSGGTESDNWAVLGGAYAMKKQGRTHVLVSEIEHHAVLSAAERLANAGFDVEYLPVNRGGRVEIAEVEKRIRKDTALVALMAANNETGAIQPIKEVCTLAKSVGALFFTDCVQYAPYKRIDVNELGADMLSLSSHKFFGPKGCGVLYIKKGVTIEKVIAGGEQERGLRGGTLNVPSIVGLAAAYEKCVNNLAENERKLKSLREILVRGLLKINGVKLNGEFLDEGSILSVVNVRIDGVENGTFLYNMDLSGIAVAAGSACASASLKPSHVLTAMGLSEKEAKSSVRFSFGKDNTQEEMEIVVKTAEKIIKKIKSN
jgi:cysteine desulfurase